MANEITMPKLDVDMQEGRIFEWKKAEGDEVNKGDILLEIVSNKTNTKTEAEDSGVPLKIVHPAGDVVAVTEIIDYIGAEGETLADSVGEEHVEQLASAQEAKAQPLQASTAPAISQKTSETGKVRATSAARKLARERGIGLEKITGNGGNGRIHKEDVEQFSKIRVTPLARRIVKDKGVDLETLVGTGVSDKIIKEDVLASLGSVAPRKGQTGVKVIPQAEVLADVTAISDGVEIIKMFAMRKAVSGGISHSYFMTSTFTLNYDIDMTNLIALRKQLIEPIMAKTGHKVTFMDLIGFAVIKTLMKEEHRFLNASLTNNAQDIELHHFVNLTIAIGFSEGLMVPVVHDADQMSLSDFVVVSKDVIQEAQAGRLKATEMSGLTFTITNLGMFGVKSFSPIINQPNPTILGISATIETPVVRDGEVVIHPIMGISLTVDHRLVDGMNEVKLMLDLKALFENPLELLI